jgi:DNA-binding NarL/FixJ family response regulator
MKSRMNQNSQAPIHVLLADDHVVVRAGTRQFLEHTGEIRVIAETGDGAEALRLLEQVQPDVAILDIQMPSLSGIEVTRQVRQRGLKMKILILTAYDDEPYVLAALRAGANGYLLKTADPGEIVQGVKDICRGKTIIDGGIALRLAILPKEGISELSARELEVLRLVGQGLTNRAAARRLQISERTVQNHLAHIFEKLQAASRTEAVMKAVAQGLLPADLAGMASPQGEM